MSPGQSAGWLRAGLAAWAILGWSEPARAIVLLAEDFEGLPLQASVSPTEVIAPSLSSPVVSLDGVPANSVVVSFVSSFRYEDSQAGLLDVSYDGGTTYSSLRAYLPSDPEAA